MRLAADINAIAPKGKRKRIYALQPKGKLYRFRTALSLVYLLLFFGLPYININGNPLFLFNFPKATFILFGRIFLPQDFLLMGVGMLVALLFIIVFTLLFGRIFCGWACPQTIFMEMVFRRIEYWIEGPGQKQRIADSKKWSTELYVRKSLKHLVFLLLSFGIANTFLAYIIGVADLGKIIREPVAQHWAGLTAITGFTLVFYAVYAFVREIVCTVICPYGRLQSVLLDKDSLVVAYDYIRGEPRSRKRRSSATAEGDCIDCALCVQVCPTGIDIRNGLQLECINCTACIDACNGMMLKTGRAPGLIRIANEQAISERRRPRITAKVKTYIGLLFILSTAWLILICSRSVFDATVLRVPGQVLQENADGTISNLYRIKIVNKSMRAAPYSLQLQDSRAHIVFVGKHPDSLYPGKATEETFFMKVPAAAIRRRKEIFRLRIMSGQQLIQSRKATFIGAY